MGAAALALRARGRQTQRGTPAGVSPSRDGLGAAPPFMSGGGYRVVASTPADEPEDAALLSKTQHEEGAGGTTLAEPAGKWRWVTALMACMMWLCTYADRTNISLAIVEMESEFGWSAASDGVVLSSFFVGYTTTQILGGYLAAKWSGYKVMAVAVGLYSTATLLTPIAARTSMNALLATRVALGIGEGLALPALHQVTAGWAPTHERSRFITISVSGQYLGSTATLLCAPMVHAWWPSIFYLFGSIGIAWVITWALIGGDSAATHRYISDAERNYITASVPVAQKVDVVPWRALCTEPCFV